MTTVDLDAAGDLTIGSRVLLDGVGDCGYAAAQHLQFFLALGMLLMMINPRVRSCN